MKRRDVCIPSPIRLVAVAVVARAGEHSRDPGRDGAGPLQSLRLIERRIGVPRVCELQTDEEQRQDHHCPFQLFTDKEQSTKPALSPSPARPASEPQLR